MPKLIIEIRNPRDDDDRRLIEYTTIMDAPTTYGMTREQFREWYDGDDLDERLARVDARGHSNVVEDEGWESPLFCNRAGPDEANLTTAELWHCYVTRAPESPACWSYLPTEAVLAEYRNSPAPARSR